jgi:hypothetical protein
VLLHVVRSFFHRKSIAMLTTNQLCRSMSQATIIMSIYVLFKITWFYIFLMYAFPDSHGLHWRFPTGPSH